MADVDGDGDLDALIDDTSMWLNDGDGRFLDRGQRLGSEERQSAAFGDMDGDGDLDALAYTRDDVRVLLNVAPPNQAVWDGVAAVGRPGDGIRWEDENNWTVDDTPDLAPRLQSPGDDLVFASKGERTIQLADHAIANSLTFEQDVTLQGQTLTVTSGVVNVEPGATGTILSTLIGPSIIEKTGDGTLVIQDPNGTMFVESGVLRAGGRVIWLTVASEASVSLGNLAVNANATIEGTLVADVGSETGGLVVGAVLTLGANSTLRIQPFGPLEEFGETTHTIATANWVEGVFRNVPMTGEHLGYGVVAGDATDSGIPVIYERQRIKVILYQAAPGDANGDRRFDQLDIVDLLSSNKYLQTEPADWTEGDFAGDGQFDQRDIIAALQSGG